MPLDEPERQFHSKWSSPSFGAKDPEDFLGRRPATPGRDVAGRPKATGNGSKRKLVLQVVLLENSSEEAGAAAQQTAENPAETEGSAADGRAAEAALAADLRRRQHVADRTDDLQRTVAGLAGQASYDLTELIVAGEDAAFVTEDSTLSAE